MKTESSPFAPNSRLELSKTLDGCQKISIFFDIRLEKKNMDMSLVGLEPTTALL